MAARAAWVGHRQNFVMPEPSAADSAECSTIEAARLLGMAVRSVQLMVDRGELVAWKTPGGHRRIARASVDAWLARRTAVTAEALDPGLQAAPPSPMAHGTLRAALAHTQERVVAPAAPDTTAPTPQRWPRLLLIEDSAHYQNLISLLIRQHLPQAQLLVATDGIAGLAMAGRESPDVLIIDILLPGIDGATLITSLRSQPLFQQTVLWVVTSLDESQREPYAFALQGLPVIHKTRLVAELPQLLRGWQPLDPLPPAAAPPQP
jgi:excisionase family DNA binding protein